MWDIDSASAASGANLQLYRDNGTNAQKFEFTYNQDGYYTIRNVNSGKAVDCAGGASADGTNIRQYASNNSNAQRWKLKSAGNGYYSLMCKCNGKMADVSGGTAANGTNIQVYQPNGSAAQKFKLVKTVPAKGNSQYSARRIKGGQAFLTAKDQAAKKRTCPVLAAGYCHMSMLYII